MIVLLIIISTIMFILSFMFDCDGIGYLSGLCFFCIICYFYIFGNFRINRKKHRRKDFNVPGRKYENRKTARYIDF